MNSDCAAMCTTQNHAIDSVDIEHYTAKAAREGSYGNRSEFFHRCGTLAERWLGKETRKIPCQNRDWKGGEVTVSFQHLRHVIYLQLPFSRQTVKWKRNSMEKDLILQHQISSTRTLVVSHWPLCPAQLAPSPESKSDPLANHLHRPAAMEIDSAWRVFFQMLPCESSMFFWFRGSP